MPAGQLFATNSLGGFYSSFNLSKELRKGVQATNKFRQFADVRDAWGKVTQSGQTFTWDTVPMMTRASRQLVETATIPSAQHTVLQGTLTMYERGVAVPYTQFLENMSMLSVRTPIMKVLKYDAKCDIDCTVWQEFNKSPLRAAFTSSADSSGTFTTNSTASATNTVGMSNVNVRSIVDYMKGRNIPFYSDEHYYCIGRPKSFRALKNDIEAMHQYTETGLELIMNGEIGRYENTKFVEQTTIPTGGAADSSSFDPFTDTGDAWDGTTAGDWAFFFGADTVCEAVHTEEEIRAKNPDDYGRSKGIAWFALLGYGLTHGSGANQSVTQARVVKFDSAK